MKKVFWVLSTVGLLLLHSPCFAEAPHRIAGLALGANISEYKELLRMDSVIPIRHTEYLSEIETKKIEGFKSGYILFGTCEEPGRIVKIKMKYARSDKRFFEELFERFKKKFGKPGEWKGDPFQTLIAWKWSLTDKNNNKISMILQHYAGDDEEYTRGNSLRMTMVGLIERERLCYEKKHPEAPETAVQPPTKIKGPTHNGDFQGFIPE